MGNLILYQTQMKFILLILTFFLAMCKADEDLKNLMKDLDDFGKEWDKAEKKENAEWDKAKKEWDEAGEAVAGALIGCYIAIVVGILCCITLCIVIICCIIKKSNEPPQTTV